MSKQSMADFACYFSKTKIFKTHKIKHKTFVANGLKEFYPSENSIFRLIHPPMRKFYKEYDVMNF